MTTCSTPPTACGARRKHFEAWTRSEAFRKAHAGSGSNKPLYFGHPEFEGFTVLQEVKAEGASSVAVE
jgi:heme-degrading monooxygenase HmoA